MALTVILDSPAAMFCESAASARENLAIAAPIIRKISLITSYDEETDVKEISEHLAAIWMMAIYPLTITGQRTQCAPGPWDERTGYLQVRCAVVNEQPIS